MPSTFIARGATGFLFADDFDRTDSTSTLGSPWTVGAIGANPAPVWGISSNRAYVVSDSGAALITVPGPDYTISVTAHRSDGTSGPLGSDAGLMLRYIDSNNFVAASTNIIWRYTAGAYAILATAAGGDFDGGDVLVAEVTAAGIAITRNGAAWASVSTTLHNTATEAGLMGSVLYAPTVRFDDFSITAP